MSSKRTKPMYELPDEDTGNLLPFSKRILFRRVHECNACVNARAVAAMGAITAQLATITLLEPATLNTIVPVGFKVGRGKVMVARGAYKPRLANRGDAPTSTHAAQSGKVVFANSQHRATRALAYRGW